MFRPSFNDSYIAAPRYAEAGCTIFGFLTQACGSGSLLSYMNSAVVLTPGGPILLLLTIPPFIKQRHVSRPIRRGVPRHSLTNRRLTPVFRTFRMDFLQPRMVVEVMR